MRLGMKSPELSSNKYLKDQTWPLRCAGNLEGDVADWCGHDKDGFKTYCNAANVICVSATGPTANVASLSASKMSAMRRIHR